MWVDTATDEKKIVIFAEDESGDAEVDEPVEVELDEEGKEKIRKAAEESEKEGEDGEEEAA